MVGMLRQAGIPYITATHDVNNPRSGNVMQAIGMTYRYSYEELWQPKNVLVTFRMYQLNLDGNEDRVYRKYMDNHAGFMEKDLSVHQKFPCGLKHDSPGRRAFSF